MIDQTKIYFNLPVWMQNLAVSAKGVQLQLRRYGSTGNSQAEFLTRSRQFSEVEIQNWQERAFQDLLQHAFMNVPFYQQLAKNNPDLIHHLPKLSDIDRLPIIDKSMLRTDDQDFHAEKNTVGSSVFSLGTSGSSGTPLRIICDTEARQKHYAFWTRLRKMNGLGSRASRATFFGRVVMSPASQSPPFWRIDRGQNNILFSSYHLAENNLPAYYQKLLELAPEEIIGYPSSLFLLAKFILSNKLRFPAPKVVFTTAETLLAHQRVALEKAFGTRVVDQYGCTEMVIFIAQCSHGKYHVHPEHGFLEILDQDGCRCAPGEIGEAVCTGFLNRAMPLIRYRLGDRLTAGRTGCECGSSFPVITRIEGRMDDTLITPDGRPLPRLDPVFKSVGGIAETQIIQEQMDLLVLKLVPDESFNNDLEEKLLSELALRIGSQMRVRIDKVVTIPKGKNGKFKAVVSMLPKDGV